MAFPMLFQRRDRIEKDLIGTIPLGSGMQEQDSLLSNHSVSIHIVSFTPSHPWFQVQLPHIW